MARSGLDKKPELFMGIRVATQLIDFLLIIILKMDTMDESIG
jgi:hypothetical protein